MIVRTCLLISDDPDDHVEFSEALYAISDNAILMTVSDSQKAVDLLVLKKCIPEFLFLNLATPGLIANEFFNALARDTSLNNIHIIAFGDITAPHNIDKSRIKTFLDDGMSFSELKNALKSVIGID